MARSKITSSSKDLITDDGSILVSLVHGEQTRISLTIGWITNLSGYSVTCKVVEGDNVQDSGLVPIAPAVTPVVTTLTILDVDPADNSFEIVIPETLIDTWSTTPAVDKPIYGFIGLEIRDTGVGSDQQVWKPLRGLIQVRYSPTEVS
jgi:hypothetical protein